MSAKRYDQDKSPVVEGCFHYFPRALMGVGFVSKAGADKYEVKLSEKNWLGLEQARIMNSEGRHLLKEEIEGKYDKETRLLHKAHKAWNALADLEKELASGTPLRQPIFVGATSLPEPAKKGVGAAQPGKFSNPDWSGNYLNTTEYHLICDVCGETLGSHHRDRCRLSARKL